MQTPVKEKEGLDEIITRLRAEKKKSAALWVEMGEDEAQDWVLDASYEELADEAKTAELFLSGNQIGQTQYTLPDSVKELAEAHHELYVGSFAQDKFIEGFCNGVLAFWRKVKDQL